MLPSLAKLSTRNALTGIPEDLQTLAALQVIRDQVIPQMTPAQIADMIPPETLRQLALLAAGRGLVDAQTILTAMPVDPNVLLWDAQPYGHVWWYESAYANPKPPRLLWQSHFPHARHISLNFFDTARNEYVGTSTADSLQQVMMNIVPLLKNAPNYNIPDVAINQFVRAAQVYFSLSGPSPIKPRWWFASPDELMPQQQQQQQ